RLRTDQDGIHVPGRIDAGRHLREHEDVRSPGEDPGEELEVPLPPGQVLRELPHLDAAEGGRELARLEVPTDLVEDEEVVVLDSVEIAEEGSRPLLRAEELGLAA